MADYDRYPDRNRPAYSSTTRKMARHSPPASLHIGYDRKALPPLPSAASFQTQNRGSSSSGSSGSGSPLARLLADSYMFTRRHPPSILTSVAAETRLSDEPLLSPPKMSSRKILQLTGLVSAGDLAVHSTVGTCPRMHRSSQKIRQLIGHDVGNDTTANISRAPKPAGRDASPSFANSPPSTPPDWCYGPSRAQQPHQPAADTNLLREQRLTVYPSSPAGTASSPCSPREAIMFSLKDSAGRHNGPVRHQQSPTSFPFRVATSLLRERTPIGQYPIASFQPSAAVAPLRISKPASTTGPGAKAASDILQTGFSERDLLDFFNRNDDLVADDDDEQPYLGDEEEALSEDDDDDDDEFDAQHLYHATASQLATPSPTTALELTPPPQQQPCSAFDSDSDDPVSLRHRFAAAAAEGSAPLLQRTNEHLHDLVSSAALRTAGLLVSREERRRASLRRKIRVVTQAGSTM